MDCFAGQLYLFLFFGIISFIFLFFVKTSLFELKLKGTKIEKDKAFEKKETNFLIGNDERNQIDFIDNLLLNSGILFHNDYYLSKKCDKNSTMICGKIEPINMFLCLKNINTCPDIELSLINNGKNIEYNLTIDDKSYYISFDKEEYKQKRTYNYINKAENNNDTSDGEKCNYFLGNITQGQNDYLNGISKYNKIVKYSLIGIFILSILCISFILCVVFSGGIDSDSEGNCLSLSYEDSFRDDCCFGFILWGIMTALTTLILFFSCLSIIFSNKFIESVEENCSFQYNIDYYIDGFDKNYNTMFGFLVIYGINGLASIIAFIIGIINYFKYSCKVDN